MWCAAYVYRSSIGLFVPIFWQFAKTCEESSEAAKERQVQSTMAVLAATTLLSLLVRGGVERNLEPDIERTLDRLYGRTDSRLFQTEGQITC